MTDSRAVVRNVLIVVALAAIVYAVPGGGDGADFVGAALSSAITAMFVLIGVKLYREHRVDVFSLGERWRAVLYGGLAACIFAMAARRELWETGAGTFVWLAIIGAASYGFVLTWRHWRSYQF